MRSYDAMFDASGACVVCGQIRTIAGRDVHSELHLAQGTAVVDSRPVRGVRVERVIPNSNPLAPESPEQRVRRELALTRERVKAALARSQKGKV